MLRLLIAAALLVLTTSLSAATLTNDVVVNCAVFTMAATSNPCELTGQSPTEPSLGYANAQASVSVGYGFVTGTVLSNADHGGSASVDITAGFLDRFTIFGLGMGLLELDVALPGCLACNASMTSTLQIGDTTEMIPGAFPETRTLSFPIALGRWVDLSGQLEIRSRASDNDDNTNESFDFRVAEIRAYDSTGTQLKNLRYQTVSGQRYPLAFAVDVPEPATVTLFMGSFLVLFAGRFRRLS